MSVSKWKVRKWRRPNGRTITGIWEAFEPDGSFSGAFETWAEAMEWATSPVARIEHWLAHQVKS